jgi:hypothetical protein
MSAIGTKRTWQRRRSMSAFGGKARISLELAGDGECPLLGVKRTYPFALQMSAFDPKRTFVCP